MMMTIMAKIIVLQCCYSTKDDNNVSTSIVQEEDNNDDYDKEDNDESSVEYMSHHLYKDATITATTTDSVEVLMAVPVSPGVGAEVGPFSTNSYTTY